MAGPQASGNLGAATDAVGLEVRGQATMGFQVLGTWVGTLAFEVSLNGIDWSALNVVPPNGTTAVTTTTANGIWAGSVAGMAQARIRFSAFTSGMASVHLQGASGGGSSSGGGGGGGGGACTIADGADVAEGATTDAAVVTDTTGTVSGKLRGLVKWAFERMPASLGQKVMALSFPVTLASDQSALAITAAALPLPAGAATEATLATRAADATLTARLGTLGQKAMAASTPVVVASDQSNLPVAPANVVSTANSTTAALGAGAVFTGTAEDITGYAIVFLNVFASHASAADGLSIQQSSNGANWDITDVYTVAAATGKVFSFNPAAQFFRVVYTNGATLQTAFRLQTLFKRVYAKPSSQRPSDAYSNEVDLEQAQVFQMVWNGTGWDRQPGTAAGGAAMNVAQFGGNAVVTGIGAAAVGVPRITPSRDDSPVTGTINSATPFSGSASLPVSVQGWTSAGAQIQAGTLAASLIFEQSQDSGTTYLPSTIIVNGVQVLGGALVLTNPNAVQSIGWFINGAVSHVRIRVTAFTSGSAVATVRASTIADAFGVGGLTSGFVGIGAPLFSNIIGGKAVTGALAQSSLNGAAAYALYDVYGRQVMRKRDSWAITNAPIVATAATISQAAGATGVKNVCTSISISLASTGAPTAGIVQFNLRDGATGAGTILQTWRLSVPGVAGECRVVTLGDLWIEGTAATAMTLETSAAPAANTFATVAMTGTVSQ